MRRVLAAIIRAIFALLTRSRVEGSERIPAEGPLLVVANHFHFIDPLAVINAVRRPLDFVGGFHMPFAPAAVRFIPRLWGLYRIPRGKEGFARAALRGAEATLRGGGIVGIFPEGGSWTNVLRRPRPGTAFLAARTGVRVLPIGIDGTDGILPSLRRFRRQRVTVRVGSPIGPFRADGTARPGRDQLDTIGDAIMRAVAELLPESRRGVYSPDPDVRRAAESVAAYPWERTSRHDPTPRAKEGEPHE
ncbi:MAG: lysophospholipid acyltransferase family protein [Candidatus Bipolaricaulis sp.]|nr:lysophospholipid acyltransferase family protein [Candidatus Bipolaricaulis sp.]